MIIEIMVYGYIRVSSDKQTVENQRFEIEQFCRREGLTIDGWIEETVSGTKPYSKRQLGKLLRHVGKGDLILCSELSRLGRSLYMIMEFSVTACTAVVWFGRSKTATGWAMTSNPKYWLSPSGSRQR